jgi:hypothetical protein
LIILNKKSTQWMIWMEQLTKMMMIIKTHLPSEVESGAQSQMQLKQGTLQRCSKSCKRCRRWRNNKPLISKISRWLTEEEMLRVPQFRMVASFPSIKWTWIVRTSRWISTPSITLSVEQVHIQRRVESNWKPKINTWTKTLLRGSHFGLLRIKRLRRKIHLWKTTLMISRR